MKQGVIFIASLSHSGSTLLNLLLGSHPRLVGLGEVDSVLQLSQEGLESEKGMPCSCGQRVASCEFWGPTFAALQQQPRATLAQKYGIVFKTFEKIYGPEFQIVDSSKYLTQLNNVRSIPNIDLKVVHLIKDVRAYTISQRDIIDADFKYRRLPILLGSIKFSRWVYRNSIKAPGYLFWKWYLDNRAIQRQLANLGLRTTHISYDELAQHPGEVMEKLFRFLGLENPAEKTLAPNRTHSHAFMGNQMLGDPVKMSEIRYDDRWRQRADWYWATRLFPRIVAYNNELVHSNHGTQN